MSQQSDDKITGILKVVGADLFANSERIKKILYQREGVLRVHVNPYTEKVYVDYDPSKVCWEEIRRLVAVAIHEQDESKIISTSEHTNP